MVFLALTRNGLNEAIKLAESRDITIWCGADVISETEYKALTLNPVSRFNYGLFNENTEVVADAIDTIGEHHPNEIVWVEHVPNS